MTDRRLKLLSSNIQAGSTTRAYSEYVTRSWSHVLPNGKRGNLDELAQTYAPFDVVGLQECDPGSLRSGFSNQSDYLAEKAGFPFSSHQATRRISRFAGSGNALLSRLKPSKIDHFVLPSRIPGRGVLLAEFANEGLPWHIAVTHLSLSASARRVQIAYLAELLSDRPRLVLMGDFNCDCRSHSLRQRARESGLQGLDCELKTFPSWRPRRNLDHILVSGSLRILEVEVLDYVFSDHLPLSMTVALPSGVHVL